MSFITGTQCELLYAMPASGTAVTAASITVLSGSTNANPAYQLPANYFSYTPANGPGKSLLIKGGGFYTVGTTAVTDVITIGLDSTRGTLGTTLAKSGAWTTVISQSNVEFEFEVMVTLTVVGQGGGTNASVNSMGHLLVGQANDAANPTLQTVGAQWATPIMIGAAQTAKTFDPTVGQYVEVFNTWSAVTGSPTATLTNFYVFGLN
jgi:hypothetical protein